MRRTKAYVSTFKHELHLKRKRITTLSSSADCCTFACDSLCNYPLASQCVSYAITALQWSQRHIRNNVRQKAPSNRSQWFLFRNCSSGVSTMPITNRLPNLSKDTVPKNGSFVSNQIVQFTSDFAWKQRLLDLVIQFIVSIIVHLQPLQLDSSRKKISEISTLITFEARRAKATTVCEFWKVNLAWIGAEAKIFSIEYIWHKIFDAAFRSEPKIMLRRIQNFTPTPATAAQHFCKQAIFCYRTTTHQTIRYTVRPQHSMNRSDISSHWRKIMLQPLVSKQTFSFGITSIKCGTFFIRFDLTSEVLRNIGSLYLHYFSWNYPF